MTSLIHLYRPDDRAAVLRIAADTAFFGRPIEAFLPDRQGTLCRFRLEAGVLGRLLTGRYHLGSRGWAYIGRTR